MAESLKYWSAIVSVQQIIHLYTNADSRRYALMYVCQYIDIHSIPIFVTRFLSLSLTLSLSLYHTLSLLFTLSLSLYFSLSLSISLYFSRYFSLSISLDIISPLLSVSFCLILCINFPVDDAL